mgnify:CR=1 FL=1
MTRPGGVPFRTIYLCGRVTVGVLFGYDYDYDDDGNELLEFDVENEQGFLIGCIEDEIERIEVLA